MYSRIGTVGMLDARYTIIYCPIQQWLLISVLWLGFFIILVDRWSRPLCRDSHVLIFILLFIIIISLNIWRRVCRFLLLKAKRDLKQETIIIHYLRQAWDCHYFGWFGFQEARLGECNDKHPPARLGRSHYCWRNKEWAEEPPRDHRIHLLFSPQLKRQTFHSLYHGS